MISQNCRMRESKLLKTLKELFKIEEYKPVKNENSKHK